MSEISLGLGVSHQDLTALKPFSELCLGFQIRQAGCMELLYVSYLQNNPGSRSFIF